MGWDGGVRSVCGLSSWNTSSGGLWATFRIGVVARVRGAGKRNWYNWATTKRTVRRRSWSDGAERLRSARYAFDRMASLTSDAECEPAEGGPT